jgi:CRP-like cAMP-binding protein
MKELEKIFKQILHQFSDETLTIFSEGFTLQELKKGDYFLREGERCNHLAFIESGAMMCYYIKDGKRFIDEFSLDNEFITDYSSFLTHSPSNKHIQCLENCKFYVISSDRLNDLYQVKSTDFERLGRVMAEQLYLQWHEKSKSLLCISALV